MITPGSIRNAKQHAVGGKKARCSIGKSCSATCIYALKVCLVDLPDTVGSSLSKLSAFIQKKSLEVSRQAKKVLPGMRGKYLAGRKEKYQTVRDKLVKQIERASLRRDDNKVQSLNAKLAKLQGGVGSKLKSPNVEPKLSESGNSERRQKYYRVKESIIEKMRDAAIADRRGTFEKWENILLSLEKKAGGKFGDDDLTRKGDGWKFTKYERERHRSNNYKYHSNLKEKEVYRAARDGDFKLYRKAEDALIKMERGAGKKLGLPGETIKNRIWRDTKEKSLDRVGDTHYKVTRGILKAVASGNRDRYNRLEKVIKRIEKSPELGSDALRIYGSKGQIWADYKGVAKFADRLDKAGISQESKRVKDVRLIPYGDGGALNINSKINGNKLSLEILPNSFSFKVNDKLLVDEDMPLRDKIAITKEIKRQFGIVIKNFKDSVIEVSAARGDGRQDMRERAYTEAGFSRPSGNGEMFGRITNGKMSPATSKEFYDEKSPDF